MRSEGEEEERKGEIDEREEEGREEEGRGERREREKEDRNALAEDEMDRQNCM